MDALQILSVVFLFLLALYWLGTYNFAVITSLNIPGPTPWPFIGNLLDIRRFGNLDKLLHAYRDRYGKVFHLSLGQETFIVVADPELLKLITIKEFDKFRNRAYVIKKPKYISLGKSCDQDWKRIRTTLNPTFSASKMKQMVPLIQDSCDVLMSKYRQAAESGKAVDVKEFSQQYILEVLMSTAFGMEMNTQTEPQKELAETVTKFFNNRNRILWGVSLIPFYRSMRYLLGYIVEFFRSDYLHKIAYRIITQRKQQGIDADSRKDFVNLMLTTTDSDGNRKLSDGEIIAQSAGFLLAGLHTSSTRIIFALYCLARFPDIQEKLHNEVADGFHANPDMSMYDLVQNIEYLDCFFNEILRVFVRGNNSGASNRYCNESCTLNGVYFPKGIGVMLGYGLVHHDEDYWREPSKFDPERFRGQEKEQRDPFLFSPFGAGPRHCIGMRFAQMEIKITLARLVKDLRFKFTAGTKVPVGEILPQNILANKVELIVENRNKKAYKIDTSTIR